VNHSPSFLTRPLTLSLVFASVAALAQQRPIAAPNLVEITPLLITSGQPSAEALAGLGAQGFEAVIYLAPPTVADAVRDEAVIVGRQGLVYVNIPVKFDSPTTKDFEVFAATLSALGKRKVLVHCQINLRASSMVFLYRVIVGKEDPQLAYEAVTKVWAPDGPWKRLIDEQLRKNGVNFEPY
jgi:protein tyrosine phosphatase (PTP) superfamily phosphohydrolase (DUF442 family)